MKKNRDYSKEENEFLQSRYKNMSVYELYKAYAKEFGEVRTYGAIKSYLGNRGLVAGVKNYKRKYNDEVIEFVRSNVKKYTDKEIAEMVTEKFDIKASASAITNLKARQGIRSEVRRGVFEKGQVAYNKGMKQTDFMSPEAIERTKATRFKKGQKPINHRPVGSERVTTDGFVEIKTAEPSTWELKHRLIWEKEHGEIPEGNMITFLDGDSTNLDLDNMRLITMEQNAYLNKQSLRVKGDAELTETGIILSELMAKTNELKRGD